MLSTHAMLLCHLISLALAETPPAALQSRLLAATPKTTAPTAAETAAAAATSHFLGALAPATGYVVSAGALVVYAPVIANVLSSGSADGLSVATCATLVVGHRFCLVYPLRRGYPLSSFLEYALIEVQALILFVLTASLRLCGTGCSVATAVARAAPELLAGAALLLVSWAYAVPRVPAVALTALQACSTTMMTGAIVPQIVSNFRSRSSGGWSPVTAALCVAGNMARVFTSAQQTGDRLLLCGFAVGATLQATLLTQCLLFR